MTLLEKAIKTDDLDDALFPLQTALGIESGDVAAQHFSQYDDANDEWKNASPIDRRDMLTAYLSTELVWAVS